MKIPECKVLLVIYIIAKWITRKIIFKINNKLSILLLLPKYGIP